MIIIQFQRNAADIFCNFVHSAAWPRGAEPTFTMCSLFWFAVCSLCWILCDSSFSARWPNNLKPHIKNNDIYIDD